MPPKPPRVRPPCVRAFGEPLLTEPRTYAVMGLPRGGTSMIGGLLRLCGLPFGEDLQGNHEDPDLNYDLIRRSGRDPLAEIKKVIPQRNAEHDVWGWKYPRASRYLDAVREELRNPHLIVVLRDPVAASSRHKEDEQRGPAWRYLQDLQNTNLDLIERWQVPSLLVSYERAVNHPVALTRQLARFVGLPAPEDMKKVREFVQPGTYQKLD